MIPNGHQLLSWIIISVMIQGLPLGDIYWLFYFRTLREQDAEMHANREIHNDPIATWEFNDWL